MKKIIFIFYIIFLPKIIYAYVIYADDVKIKLYGTIYGDLFYSNGSSGMLNNFYGTGSLNNTITSNSSKGSTKIGINIEYDKLEALFEAGISDPVRRFYFKYNIDKEDKHYLLIGRDTNIAHYYFGQLSNDGQGLNDFGSIISRRRMQARYGVYGLEMAFIIPYINFSNADDAAYRKKDENSKYIFYQIPRIEIAYNYNKNNFYLKPFLSYGTYLYKIDNNNYAAHQYTIGISGRSSIGRFFIDYMLYFGQNMYLNSSYGGYSGFAQAVNPVSVNNNEIKISNFYSSGGGFGIGYKINKVLFQFGAGGNANFNEQFINTQISAGSYINARYYITDMISVLFETACLNNIYDITDTNKGYALITGAMLILTF